MNEKQQILNDKFWAILLLMAINFSIQSFNWLAFENNPCSMYTYNPDCMDIWMFAANKSIRLSLNLVILWMIQWTYFPAFGKWFLYVVLSFILLAALDFFFLQGEAFLEKRIHMVIHPLAYSPLLAIILLASVFFITSSNREA